MTLSAMKSLFIISILALLPITAAPQGALFEAIDSIRIEKILQCRQKSTAGEQIIAIANEFIGEEYAASTLEQGSEEPLFISCSRLDCTTFVELVLAIAKSADDGHSRFSDVCRNLETIRYRNGNNNGYTSRLHYISWWIADSAKTGIIEEITSQISEEKQLLGLNFMSSHPDSYPLLKENPTLIKEIEQKEKPYRGIEVNYIPKEKVEHTGHHNIKPGDIIAITTSIPGLDVTHIGLAYYDNGKLCLIHASSGKGKVVKETTSLCNYLARNRHHTGIRVFRAVF